MRIAHMRQAHNYWGLVFFAVVPRMRMKQKEIYF